MEENLEIIELNDTESFLIALKVLTKLVEQLEIIISNKSITLRAFDPFDYCYIDAHFYYDKQYLLENLKEKDIGGKNEVYTQYFLIKVEDLARILPKITKSTKVKISFSKEFFTINIYKKKMHTNYYVKWSELVQPILPEPKMREYSFEGAIKSNVCYSVIDTIIQTANVISIHTMPNKGKIRFIAETRGIRSETVVELVNGQGEELHAEILYNYLKQLIRLVKAGDMVYLFISNKEPIKFVISKKDAFNVNIYFAPERKLKQMENKRKITFPLVNLDNFIEFLIHLYRQPEHCEYIYVLTNSNLETKGGDNTRFGKLLGFTVKKRGLVYLTEDGKNFIRNYVEDKKGTKQMIPTIIINEHPELKILIEDMDFSIPVNTTAAYARYREILKNKYPDVQINEIDFNTIIKILSWGDFLRFEKGQISEVKDNE